MKRLYVVRHAKSSWEQTALKDFDRPLNERGEKDAPGMARRLRNHDAQPDLICSSPAQRALATAKIFAEILGCPLSSIQYARELYHADSKEILRVIQSFGDARTSVMIVGHNPGLTDLVNELCNEVIANIPTSGVVEVQIQIDSWKNVKWGGGKQVLFDYPKKDK